MVKISEYDYAKLLTIKEMGKVPYLYLDFIPGILGTLVNCFKMPLNDDVIEGMKDGILYHFFGDVEPNWRSEKNYNWWNSLNASSFEQRGTNFRFTKEPIKESNQFKVSYLFMEH